MNFRKSLAVSLGAATLLSVVASPAQAEISKQTITDGPYCVINFSGADKLMLNNLNTPFLLEEKVTADVWNSLQGELNTTQADETFQSLKAPFLETFKTAYLITQREGAEHVSLTQQLQNAEAKFSPENLDRLKVAVQKLRQVLALKGYNADEQAKLAEKLKYYRLGYSPKRLIDLKPSLSLKYDEDGRIVAVAQGTHYHPEADINQYFDWESDYSFFPHTVDASTIKQIYRLNGSLSEQMSLHSKPHWVEINSFVNEISRLSNDDKKLLQENFVAKKDECDKFLVDESSDKHLTPEDQNYFSFDQKDEPEKKLPKDNPGAGGTGHDGNGPAVTGDDNNNNNPPANDPSDAGSSFGKDGKDGDDNTMLIIGGIIAIIAAIAAGAGAVQAGLLPPPPR